MRLSRSDGESRPMTLGHALAAKVRLIVWCKACGHRAEPDIADLVARYGEGTTVIDWARRLRCSACDGRDVDFVVSRASGALPHGTGEEQKVFGFARASTP